MAETLISPGTLARENDSTQITSQPVRAGMAIVGPTVKGKPNIPTLVTSYSEYVATFGNKFTSGSGATSIEATFLTSISAQNYFANGGDSLLVTRIATGAFAAASSSFISSSWTSGPYSASSVFDLETLGQGTYINSGDGTYPSSTTTGSNGTLLSGSKDNIRWEIVNPNSSSGIFNLLIRRGDDKTNSKVILEEFRNLSLDPKASNYISKIVGDQTTTLRTDDDGNEYLQPSGSYPNSSRYVRVKAVNLNTPDYFDNNGSPRDIYTASIPVAKSGTFDGGLGDVYVGANTLYNNMGSTTQGLTVGNYTTALNLLGNQDEFKFNVLTAPGLTYDNHSTALNTLIEKCENRGDAISVIDLVSYGGTNTTVTSQAANIDSSYAAAYWPWIQITEPDTGQLVWVPASTMIPGVYANNDIVGEPWFAAAGIKRGGLDRVRQAERKLTIAARDTLYVGKVNPIATFPGKGIVVFGNKTLQTQASSLDRVNVRRLLIELKNHISQVADNLVFEQNTTATRNDFLSEVNPYLESVQQRQGVYAFKVVMDDTNNTNDVIDRNEMVGAIYIQPTRTAEFIYLDFNILPTGATFPS